MRLKTMLSTIQDCGLCVQHSAYVLSEAEGQFKWSTYLTSIRVLTLLTAVKEGLHATRS
jgi:hypothetical protein